MKKALSLLGIVALVATLFAAAIPVGAASAGRQGPQEKGESYDEYSPPRRRPALQTVLCRHLCLLPVRRRHLEGPRRPDGSMCTKI